MLLSFCLFTFSKTPIGLATSVKGLGAIIYQHTLNKIYFTFLFVHLTRIQPIGWIPIGIILLLCMLLLDQRLKIFLVANIEKNLFAFFFRE